MLQGQVPKATDAVPGPAASAAASSHLPAPPYYSQPNAYQFTSQVKALSTFPLYLSEIQTDTLTTLLQPPPPAPHGALCPVRGAIEQEPGSKTQPVFNQMMRTHDSYPYFMQSQGRVDDFPPSSAPAPSKFGSASRVEAATSLGSQEPPTSSAAASSAPAAAQFQQPMVPQVGFTCSLSSHFASEQLPFL